MKLGHLNGKVIWGALQAMKIGREKPLLDKERSIRRELFFTTAAALALVDHSRRIKRKIPIPGIINRQLSLSTRS
jgi:hypothetical protein